MKLIHFLCVQPPCLCSAMWAGVHPTATSNLYSTVLTWIWLSLSQQSLQLCAGTVSVWVYHCLVEWPSGRFSVRCLCRGWRACRGLRKVMTLNRVFRSWAVKQWPKIKKNDLGNWTLGRCKTAECVVETPSAELITFSNSIFMHSLSWSFLFTIFPERHFVKSWSLFCHKCLDRLHKYEVTHFFVHQFSIFVNNVSHKRAKSY